MTELESAYGAYGMDWAAAIERVDGDDELLRELLSMFSADGSYDELMCALTERDAQRGFRAAHSLKGSSGMLGMTGLFEALKAITEPLRRGDAQAAEELRGAVEREYARCAGMIRGL